MMGANKPSRVSVPWIFVLLICNNWNKRLLNLNLNLKIQINFGLVWLRPSISYFHFETSSFYQTFSLLSICVVLYIFSGIFTGTIAGFHYFKSPSHTGPTGIVLCGWLILADLKAWSGRLGCRWLALDFKRCFWNSTNYSHLTCKTGFTCFYFVRSPSAESRLQCYCHRGIHTRHPRVT